MKLILASQSPRRRELLDQAGFEFSTFPVKVSENIDENLNPEVQVRTLALRKAEACINQNKQLKSQGFLVLGADTMVFLANQSLGKPADFSQAVDFLSRLSGQTHRVITGLALVPTDHSPAWVGHSVTEVTFRSLSSEEIVEYVQTGEPMDKAGAYGIQGLAQKFVSSKSGSWSNVVGLPLESLELALKERGWNVDRKKSADRSSKN